MTDKEKTFRKWLDDEFDRYREMYRDALENDDDNGLTYLGKANLLTNVILKFEEVFCDEED